MLPADKDVLAAAKLWEMFTSFDSGQDMRQCAVAHHDMCTNVQPQSELDAARKSHKEALEAASAAEKKAVLLEVRPPAGIAASSNHSTTIRCALFFGAF
jgi:uncharacterized protein (DUF2345 family)